MTLGASVQSRHAKRNAGLEEKWEVTVPLLGLISKDRGRQIAGEIEIEVRSIRFPKTLSRDEKIF